MPMPQLPSPFSHHQSEAYVSACRRHDRLCRAVKLKHPSDLLGQRYLVKIPSSKGGSWHMTLCSPKLHLAQRVTDVNRLTWQFKTNQIWVKEQLCRRGASRSPFGGSAP